MKITKKVTTVEQVEIEVSLPYFTKADSACYCIIDEFNMLRVYSADLPSFPSFYTIQYTVITDEALKGEPITSKEFEAAYIKATDYLADTFESMRDTIRESKNEVYDNVTIN